MAEGMPVVMTCLLLWICMLGVADITLLSGPTLPGRPLLTGVSC